MTAELPGPSGPAGGATAGAAVSGPPECGSGTAPGSPVGCARSAAVAVSPTVPRAALPTGPVPRCARRSDRGGLTAP
ncbi:hypothetical protein GCM10018793_57060 [Streptomyces sulfonofaciens]|uniref:Uncharacterized protein n=1 Tax=Streptomyces sulfonofaciens TaxID=68272 RepID=A0A919GKH3_9ACTN|nr:hypothetical protein GCM10018793_57060 [Streptomyces sulfonofaciens]